MSVPAGAVTRTVFVCSQTLAQPVGARRNLVVVRVHAADHDRLGHARAASRPGRPPGWPPAASRCASATSTSDRARCPPASSARPPPAAAPRRCSAAAASRRAARRARGRARRAAGARPIARSGSSVTTSTRSPGLGAHAVADGDGGGRQQLSRDFRHRSNPFLPRPAYASASSASVTTPCSNGILYPFFSSAIAPLSRQPRPPRPPRVGRERLAGDRPLDRFRPPRHGRHAREHDARALHLAVLDRAAPARRRRARSPTPRAPRTFRYELRSPGSAGGSRTSVRISFFSRIVSVVTPSRGRRRTTRAGPAGCRPGRRCGPSRRAR